MQIKFLKTGKFSINPVTGPIITCTEGAIADVPAAHAETLLKYGWAGILKNKKLPEAAPPVENKPMRKKGNQKK